MYRQRKNRVVVVIVNVILDCKDMLAGEVGDVWSLKVGRTLKHLD